MFVLYKYTDKVISNSAPKYELLNTDVPVIMLVFKEGIFSLYYCVFKREVLDVLYFFIFAFVL